MAEKPELRHPSHLPAEEHHLPAAAIYPQRTATSPQRTGRTSGRTRSCASRSTSPGTETAASTASTGSTRSTRGSSATTSGATTTRRRCADSSGGRGLAVLRHSVVGRPLRRLHAKLWHAPVRCLNERLHNAGIPPPTLALTPEIVEGETCRTGRLWARPGRRSITASSRLAHQMREVVQWDLTRSRVCQRLSMTLCARASLPRTLC